MKKLIISISLLMGALILKAQTYTSYQINIWNSPKNISIKNDEGKMLFTVQSHFKRNPMVKARVKSIVIDDKKYLIKKEKKGIHQVYTSDWKLVATMSKRGESIKFVEDNSLYHLQENVGWFRLLDRIYLNQKEEKVVYISLKNGIYVINLSVEKSEKMDLLMALSLHQLMELVAREKADAARFN